VAGEKLVIRRMTNTLKNWWILFVDGDLKRLNHVLASLHAKLERPLALMGPCQVGSLQSSSLVVSASSSAPSPGSSIPKVAQPTTFKVAVRGSSSSAGVCLNVIASRVPVENFETLSIQREHGEKTLNLNA